LGGIDLPTVQKYLNLWYTLSLDLFGGEVSSNAADAFAAGIKGRHKEDKYAEHKLVDSFFAMDVLENGAVVTHKDIAMRNALNEVLRASPTRSGTAAAASGYPHPGRRGLRQELDAAGHRARQDGVLAGAAAQGHQQPARRVRVRPPVGSISC
jgi:hypothetical protein